LAVEPPTLSLRPEVQVDGAGIFVSQLLEGPALAPVTGVRLQEAPPVNRPVTLTRTQIVEALKRAGPEWGSARWEGPEAVRVLRRARPLAESELKDKLTVVLQSEQVRDKGELELRLMRPWPAITVPDEPLSLRVLDLPTSGVSGNFIVRFELSAGGGREVLGAWQMPLQAKVWREIWVAKSALPRNQPFREAPVARERRDVLALREAPLTVAEPDPAWEIAEHVPSGAPLYARSVRLRPVVHRGQVVDAQLREGPIVISLKVEVMENGSPGQTVRVRNVQSRREFRGKVENEQTVLVVL
jgi:flagella basal body P-ring formation protein FlgA